MKNKFIKWILNWAIRVGPEESQEAYLKKTKKIIAELYSTYNPAFDGNKFDRDMAEVLFDIKYSYFEEGSIIRPYEHLTNFYTMAKEGNNSFLRASFFRVLRLNKDREVKKLLHILDRNTK